MYPSGSTSTVESEGVLACSHSADGLQRLLVAVGLHVADEDRVLDTGRNHGRQEQRSEDIFGLRGELPSFALHPFHHGRDTKDRQDQRNPKQRIEIMKVKRCPGEDQTKNSSTPKTAAAATVFFPRNGAPPLRPGRPSATPPPEKAPTRFHAHRRAKGRAARGTPAPPGLAAAAASRAFRRHTIWR